MRVYEPYNFACPSCGARLKPDGSLGLFFCPECRKIYDAGDNRHLAKESKYYRNTLRKSAPDVFTVAAFSYYESVNNCDERAEAAGEDIAADADFADYNRGLFRAASVEKRADFLNELLRRGAEYEKQRQFALSLIAAMPVELKRGGNPLCKDYESYALNLNVPCDLREAVELSEEMYCRGSSYYGERNYAEAVKNLTSSANMGHIKACYLLAMCYVNGYGVDKDVYTAIDFMRRAAEAGDQDAQFELGMIYGNAKLGVKDARESAKWLRASADQGDKRAQGILGVYYLNGIGVPQSDYNAVLWVRKAAAQGFAEAQCMLGAVYADGRGVMKNIPEARSWYNKAIAQGNRLAREQLRGLEEELAAARRRREEAERRRQSSYSYNRPTSSGSNGYNNNRPLTPQNNYNRSSSSYNRSSSSSSGSGGTINWGIFFLLFIFFFPLAIVYAFVQGNKTAKTVIGVIFGILIFLIIIVAAASSCAYNVPLYGLCL